VNAGLPPTARPLVVATYNVHGWVGTDGRRDPERAGETLAELGADVIALQEVRCGQGMPDVLERIAELLKMESLRGLVHERRDEAHGNALLSRFAITAAARLELTVGGREPRGAIDVALDTGGEPLRVVATHLGIGPRERRPRCAASSRTSRRPTPARSSCSAT
jgi:endonuclease/exonuclease/phosphatase family metal-dependent hydrolase